MKVGFKEIKGMPVYDMGTEEPWGKISDVVFDGENKKVIAILVDSISLVPLNKKVSYEKIEAIFKDKVILKKGTRGSDLNNISVKDCIGEKTKVHGKQKKLNNLIFDTEIGQLTDIVVSKSIFWPKTQIPANKIYLKDNTIYVTNSERGEE